MCYGREHPDSFSTHTEDGHLSYSKALMKPSFVGRVLFKVIPLSMFIYAIATMPLIQELESTTSVTQLWYANDSAALRDLP